jgi:outer membrane lipoprotein-sorting protein
MKNKSTYLFALLLISSIISSLYGQQASDSDPAAKKILQNLKQAYDSYKSMEINFDLTLNLPDQAPEKQKGYVIQNGDKYKLELEQQAVYCNGKTVWVHLKDNNEVQINDVEETTDDSFLTPQDMLSIYESEDFYYAITNNFSKKGKEYNSIEFKPLQENSEYTKMRILVNTTENQISNMEIFSRDGSKYTLEVNSFNINKDFPNTFFNFQSANYPGIHIEDLRF